MDWMHIQSRMTQLSSPASFLLIPMPAAPATVRADPFALLNDQQREAVEHGVAAHTSAGPLLVLLMEMEQCLRKVILLY